MGRIQESIDIDATPQTIWDYVQDYHHRTEWDATVARFEPVGAERVDRGVTVRIRAPGFPAIEYEAIYVSFEPYKVSAVKLTRPIQNVLFTSAAGSWRYQQLGDGKTHFTMTFDCEIVGGIVGRVLDKVWLEPTLRRAMKRSLRNLQTRLSGRR